MRSPVIAAVAAACLALPGPVFAIFDDDVARVDLTATPGAKSPLTDPNNILSRRSIFYDYDSYDVKDQYKDLVEAHARYLRDNPRTKMLIQIKGKSAAAGK